MTPEEKAEYRKQWRLDNLERCRAYGRKSYHKHKPKRNEVSTQWRKDNPELHSLSVRKSYFKNKYGLSLEQFNAMLAAQGGVCAICKSTSDKWHVDHCHDSGRVRAILCKLCNPMLGYARDSTSILAAAIKYLEKHL